MTITHRLLSLFLLSFTLLLQSHVVFAADEVELTFTYGSEKAQWIKAVTEEFNQQYHKTYSGKRIIVNAIPMGSGETMKEVLEGTRRTHLVSPASGVFIELYNARYQEKSGRKLVYHTQNLVLSPVVIAMWKPMAEALGWGKNPIGWAEILNMVDHPEGWKLHGFPQWGQFKFGHTHPDFSNSGLISLLAEVYAGAGKTRGLTLEDVANPDTQFYLQSIEKAVVHYGRSTGFFGRKMFANGPEFLSAVVLYENMVIESYDSKHDLPFPIVAVYPKEGTFWSDHPVGVVDREWVTKEHRQAAQVYTDYLLDSKQQRRAVEYGFRPANLDIALGAPFDTAHGVDPKQPHTLLEVPKGKVIEAILALWKERKKHANIVLTLDISGSMRGGKIRQALKGAEQFLTMMNDADDFSLLVFNNRAEWVMQSVLLKEKRAEAEKAVKTLFAGGGTALYDGIWKAHEYLSQNMVKDKINAIVVLSDGADTNSQQNLNALLERLTLSEQNSIRVFPIAYGENASMDVLKKIANSTQTKAYKGGTGNIDKVFLDISTFF